MQGRAVSVPTGGSVLLFDEADLEETLKPGGIAAAGTSSSGPDPVVAAGINKYLAKHDSSSSRHSGGNDVEAAEQGQHSGTTDDEGEAFDEGPDYDVVGRHTIKATNQALAEVLSGVDGLGIVGKSAGQRAARGANRTSPAKPLTTVAASKAALPAPKAAAVGAAPKTAGSPVPKAAAAGAGAAAKPPPGKSPAKQP